MRWPCLAWLLCVGGCTPEVGDDLRAWAAAVRREAHEPARDAPAPATPARFAYDPAGRRDPFDVSGLSVELAEADRVLRPDAGRPREALEAYPLESLQMVGSLRRDGKSVALVQAEQLLHQVRVGDHLGQDDGEVTAISEQAIAIVERVQDGSGRWQRRQVQLAIRPAGGK